MRRRGDTHALPFAASRPKTHVFYQNRHAGIKRDANPTLFKKFRGLSHKPKDPAVFAHKIRAGNRGMNMPLRALDRLRQIMPEKLGNLQASNPAYTFAMSPRAWAQATSSCVKSVTSKCGMASPSSASVAFVIFTVAVIFISPTLGCARSILAQGIASSPMRRLMTPVDA